MLRKRDGNNMTKREIEDAGVEVLSRRSGSSLSWTSPSKRRPDVEPRDQTTKQAYGASQGTLAPRSVV
jgi:hypothetical protein